MYHLLRSPLRQVGALGQVGCVTEAVAYREVCLTCRRPRRVCWCDAVTTVPSQTRVVFIQHPREAKVPISTCRMAHRSLPNSEMHVALTAVGSPALEALCAQEGVAVLFPSDSAVDVTQVERPPHTLVVVDGTWANAKKIVQNCPLLSQLPRVAFTPETPGNYRIRKEPEAHCYSTIEAVAYVLERLEKAPGRFAPVLSVFNRMVERQLDFVAESGGRTRHVKALKPKKRSDPAAAFRAAYERLVLVFGEANSWPPDHADAPAGMAELIQLVAVRPATGERFSTLLTPRRPLSPGVPFHLELDASVFAQALPRDAALAQWQQFCGPEAVLVGWGTFCRDLLEAEGLTVPRFVNLRGLSAQVFKERPGSVEARAQALGAELPAVPGRAHRRLAALEVVVQAILRSAAPT